MRPRCRLFVALALLSAIESSALAKDDPTLFTCSYTTFSNEKGLHSAEKGFELRFMIERRTAKSYFIGNNGSTEVKLIRNADGLSFVEITDFGNVMVTAINRSGKSVHSRSSIVLGDLVPSQYYGHCQKS